MSGRPDRARPLRRVRAVTRHDPRSATVGVRADVSALAIDRGDRARRKGRRGRFGTVLPVLIVVAGLGFAGWQWKTNAAVIVETAVVSSVYPSQALTVLNATGHVVAQRQASVASKASGRLEWLGVLEGSKVTAGEVIARLESGDTEAMRDQAAANVQLAEANLGQGQADLSEVELTFTRSEALKAKNLIGEAEHDSAVARLGKARAALAGYEAAVAVARANLRLAEVALDQTLIRAPFDGIVLTRNASVGDTITPFSQAVDTRGAVVTIADMGTLEIEADVSESSFLGIHAGQPVEIQLDALPGQRFRGEVSRIVPTVDRATASTTVKIRFLDADPRMLPEMSAKVAFLAREIGSGERKPVLAVPGDAVLEAGGEARVYVVEGGRVRLVAVETGKAVGDQIEVRGLEAGTRVVLRPLAGLAEGRAVREQTE